MGRPGRGGGGGGRSSGGHSPSRISGGHRMSNGRPKSGGIMGRPGRSSSFGSTSPKVPRRPTPPPPPRLTPPPPPHPHRPPGRGGSGDYVAGMFVGSQMEKNRANNNTSQTSNSTVSKNGSTYSGGNNNYTSTARPADYKSASPKDPVNPYWIRIWSVIAVILLVITVIMGITYFWNSNQNTRNKLDVLTAYDSNCIIDNDYWFDNVSKTEKELKDFYNKTGVQPYIVINNYDPELTTDSEKTKYAEQWYDENIDNECSFLYMYFPESNPDDVGYMSYVVGKQAESVLDSDVIDTFFEYLDNDWFTDKSTDDMFYDTFKDTAWYAMKGYSVVPTIIVFAFTVCCLLLVTKYVQNSRAWEKAQETEKVLNTNIDDLAEKYAKKQEEH